MNWQQDFDMMIEVMWYQICIVNEDFFFVFVVEVVDLCVFEKVIDEVCYVDVFVQVWYFRMQVVDVVYLQVYVYFSLGCLVESVDVCVIDECIYFEGQLFVVVVLVGFDFLFDLCQKLIVYVVGSYEQVVVFFVVLVVGQIVEEIEYFVGYCLVCCEVVDVCVQMCGYWVVVFCFDVYVGEQVGLFVLYYQVYFGVCFEFNEVVNDVYVGVF